jgi:hypothetical protein
MQYGSEEYTKGSGRACYHGEFLVDQANWDGDTGCQMSALYAEAGHVRFLMGAKGFCRLDVFHFSPVWLSQKVLLMLAQRSRL